jgi:hypothetical protein
MMRRILLEKYVPVSSDLEGLGQGTMILSLFLSGDLEQLMRISQI